MKKMMCVALLCVAGVLSAFAEPKKAPVSPSKSGVVTQLWNNVVRAVSPSRVQWAKELRDEERKINANGPLGASTYAIVTKNYPQCDVRPQDKKLYQQRLSFFQGLLEKNEALKTYTFFVPFPTDLTQRLKKSEMNFLAGFLKQSIYEDKAEPAYSQYSIRKVQDGVIEVNLYQDGMGPLILWMNARQKKVFFFHSGY
jgi:hypothetical protein